MATYLPERRLRRQGAIADQHAQDVEELRLARRGFVALAALPQRLLKAALVGDGQ